MKTEIQMPGEHACYPDHFPDRTIVPGTLLLQYILEACDTDGTHVYTIKSCKFQHIVVPGQKVYLVLEGSGPERKVRLEDESRTYLRATLIVD